MCMGRRSQDDMAHSGASAQILLVERGDLDRVFTAAFFAAPGVMLALLLAVLFWPVPEVLTSAATHPILLSSTLNQVRVEPREKIFLTLAIAFGFCFAFAVLIPRLPCIEFNKRSLVLLACVVPLFNTCCGQAMNNASGEWWALGGFAASVAIAWIAIRVSR